MQIPGIWPLEPLANVVRVLLSLSAHDSRVAIRFQRAQVAKQGVPGPNHNNNNDNTCTTNTSDDYDDEYCYSTVVSVVIHILPYQETQRTHYWYLTLRKCIYHLIKDFLGSNAGADAADVDRSQSAQSIYPSGSNCISIL